MPNNFVFFPAQLDELIVRPVKSCPSACVHVNFTLWPTYPALHPENLTRTFSTYSCTLSIPIDNPPKFFFHQKIPPDIHHPDNSLLRSITPAATWASQHNGCLLMCLMKKRIYRWTLFVAKKLPILHQTYLLE